MNYEEILTQVIALLQREHRVAYRMLKRRLELDDDLLEDLKDDLIYAKQLAVDEEERVLMWRAAAGAATLGLCGRDPAAHDGLRAAHG